jgi:hypothetical protein
MDLRLELAGRYADHTWFWTGTGRDGARRRLGPVEHVVTLCGPLVGVIRLLECCRPRLAYLCWSWLHHGSRPLRNDRSRSRRRRCWPCLNGRRRRFWRRRLVLGECRNADRRQSASNNHACAKRTHRPLRFRFRVSKCVPPTRHGQ